MENKQRTISIDQDVKVVKLRVKTGTMINDNTILLIYKEMNNGSEGTEQKKLKSTKIGVVKRVSVKEGDIVKSGTVIVELEKECNHPTVIKDLCAECGADLQKENNKEGSSITQASVSMVHMVPELKVNDELAQILGKADMDRLLEYKKLVLLVDLDQTLIHTTNDNIPNNIKDVYHFQLYGSRSPWYHTRLRPGTHNFLQGISEKYELHICTFGSRRYAHMIARFLDPDGKFFSHRILSRDECFDPNSKTANLKALFPCGENMVCIIDDREDVWEYASNLIHVKPYHFFQHTGDIHAPPGLSKCENDDDKDGFDFSRLNNGSTGEGDEASSLSNNEDLSMVVEEETAASNTCDNSKVDSAGDSKENISEIATDTKVTESENTKVPEIETEPDSVNEPDAGVKDEPKTDAKETEDVAVKVEAAKVDEELPSSTSAEPVDLSEAASSSPTAADPSVVAQSDSSMVAQSVPDLSVAAQSTSDLSSVAQSVSDSSVAAQSASDSSAVAQSASDLSSAAQSVSNPLAAAQSISDPLAAAQSASEVTDHESNATEPSSSSPVESMAVDEPAAAPVEPRVSTSKVDADGFIVIEETDDYLLYLEEILKIIHAEFFRIYKSTGQIPDLKQVVPETRAKVLKGVNLVFSGIVPNRMRLEESQAYRIARSLGANVTQNIEPDSTHLVALRAGTAKVHAAYKRKHLKLVTPEWLWTCAERWEKVDERLFPLKNAKLNAEARHPPAHCRSPEHPEPSPFAFLGGSSVVNAAPSKYSAPQAGGFMYTINPLMSLSSEDIETMEGEVEDIFKESDGENDSTFEKDEEEEDDENEDSGRKRKLSRRSSSSDDGLQIAVPTLKRKKRRKLNNRNDERRTSVNDYGVDAQNDVSDDDDDDHDDEENINEGDDDKSASSESDDDETLNTKFRRGEALPSDLDLDYNTEEGTEEDQESDGEWNEMGAALEREFLEGD